jgi:hypothetical protein
MCVYVCVRARVFVRVKEGWLADKEAMARVAV